jgi:hypothetical protein
MCSLLFLPFFISCPLISDSTSSGVVCLGSGSEGELREGSEWESGDLRELVINLVGL